MNHTGQYFDRQDLYDNMHDFINDCVSNEALRTSTDQNEIYDFVMDLSTTHFEQPTKALAYPMMWTFIETYVEDRIKYRSDLVFPRKYVRVAKSVFFQRQNR